MSKKEEKGKSSHRALWSSWCQWFQWWNFNLATHMISFYFSYSFRFDLNYAVLSGWRMWLWSCYWLLCQLPWSFFCCSSFSIGKCLHSLSALFPTCFWAASCSHVYVNSKSHKSNQNTLYVVSGVSSELTLLSWCHISSFSNTLSDDIIFWWLGKL